MKGLRFRENISGILLISPQLLVTILFFIWPVCILVKQSFFASDLFGTQGHFIGFRYFHDLWTHHAYMEAWYVTLALVVGITVTSMGLGLFLAYLVCQVTHGQKIYKSLLIWPYAVAPAAVGLLWAFLAQPLFGWGPRLLHAIHIDMNYHVYSFQAFVLIWLAASWQQCSYNFLFFLVHLKKIPHTYVEAAILDGANAWRRFWNIQWPLLLPTSAFLLIMNFVYAFFDTFGMIDILTQGGPVHATTTLMYKIYRDGFYAMHIGYAAAQSIILMVVVIALTWVQFRFLDKR